MDIEEVASYVAPFDIKKVLTDLYGDKAPSIVVVYDPKAVKEMNGYFSILVMARFGTMRDIPRASFRGIEF